MQIESAQAFANSKRYVLERELGHGGMGIVYQALDLERNTRVALKALTQRDAVNIYRLKNEFRQLADLSHPNLVTLHELHNEGNAWFFTMELVNGKTFDEFVNGERPTTTTERPGVQTVAGRPVRDVSITLSQRAIGSEYPLARATCNIKRLRRALRQLVEAVAALHDAGKLHRDLKPSNVLVTPEGRVVVLDFGLVSSSTLVDPEQQDAERTVGGQMFGTPAYMSPEQAAGEAVGTASDWYAIGTMVYEALTGQLPFDGSVLEILRQKEEQEPVAPSEIVHGIPDDLDQLCRELLRRDPERRPSSAEILRYLTGHSEPPVIFDAQSSRVIRQQGELFVGRERHMTELRAAFDTAKSGKPVSVLVHGVSGMGKSALVRCFANELIRNEEAVVLRGRCYERETVPYKAFDNIIDALSRYLMGLPTEEAAQMMPRNVHSLTVLFPVLKRVKAVSYARRPKHQTSDARELRNQAFGALKDLLLRITDYHPLVINIDDLQWADMDSARLLGFLMGPPDPPPLLLIGTYRRDEADNSPFLRHILSEKNVDEGAAEVRDLPVDALSQDEAEHLATALMRDVPANNALFAGAIAAEAEGVPFFIAELVQHLQARAERGELPVAMQPVSLEQVILERVAGMPRDAQTLLEILSVAAGPLEQGVAINAAGLSNGDRTALLALRAARLVRTRGTRQSDKAETYHDRVRETIVRAMDDDAVRIAHARIAQAMERYDLADPERMVEHYSGAGDGMRAGETAVQAGHAAAQKLAFNRAAELYRRAIELLPDHGRITQRDLHKHLGDALANAGRGAQAAEAYLRAAEGAEPAEARKLQRMAAQQYLRSGRIDAGLPLAVSLLRNVGVTYPTSKAGALARIVMERTRLSFSSLRARQQPASMPASALDRIDTLAAFFKEVSAVDPFAAASLQARFLREALSAGEPSRIAEGLAWEALSLVWVGGRKKHRQVTALLSRTREMAESLDQPYIWATYWLAQAAASVSVGQFAGAEQLAAKAESTFRTHCPGSSLEVTMARTFKYAAIELGGDLATLLREAPDFERDAREKGDDCSLAYLTLVTPMALMMRDDALGALAHVEEQQQRLSGDFHTFHLWVMDRKTDALLYRGDGCAAWTYLQSQLPAFERSLLSRSELLVVNANFLVGRAAVAAERIRHTSETSDAARRAIKALRRMDRPDALTYAHLISAAIARIGNDQAGSEAELQKAAESAEQGGMGNFALYASRNLGVIAGTKGEALIERCDSALRQAGVQCPERWVATYAPGF